jgi:FkbM family methyltransferase
MRNLLSKIFGEDLYFRLEKFKKSILPTKYDILQKKDFEVQRKFYSSFIKEGDLCFDIGGNIGDKTSIFLSLNAKVVVVEPQSDCVEILKKKFGNQVSILQKGVGAENTSKKFYVSNNSQLSSFDKNWLADLESTRFSGTTVQKEETIEMATLDSLTDTYGTPVFIKIDVEGYELEVLKGLNRKFEMLSFEYAVPEGLDSVIKCLEILQNKYKNLICNYCDGNIATHFGLNNWLPIVDMKNFVQEENFKRTYAGDIYVKTQYISE